MRCLAEENPGWGAPKIHGELEKLGLVVSARTVAAICGASDAGAILEEKMADVSAQSPRSDGAFDCFTVPTVNFRWRYGFFVIEHARRTILHLHVTRHPSADWVVQQLRAAFPEAGSYRDLRSRRAVR
jgi:hypothetical protein